MKAQRLSRVIDLLFLQPRRYIGVCGQGFSKANLTPGKKSRCSLYRRLNGPRTSLYGCRKPRPHVIRYPGTSSSYRLLSFDVYAKEEGCVLFLHLCSRVFEYTWCVQVLRSPKEAFAAVMPSWRERCEKCVCLQGDYVEK